MNTKKIFSIFLILLGEALIIVSFLYFGRNLTTNILVLNIIVSSIIYLLWFVEKFIPMINLKDKTQKGVGSLGLKWVFTFLYAVSAIGVMVVFNTIRPIDVNAQIIFHGILFFLLLVGLYFVFYSSQKAGEVFGEEAGNRSRLDEIKTSTKEVKLKLDQMENIPSDITVRMTALFENLRFISPSNNREAITLEASFLRDIKVLQDCLSEIPNNFDKIIENIKNCEATFKERKQIFSN